MRRKAVDGQRRFYEDTGEGGEVIVFWHGFLVSDARPPTSRAGAVGPPLEAFLARL